MKYRERSVTEWIENGYNPIHIIGDYYLLRKHSLRYKDFSIYHLAKIHDTIPPIKQCLCGGDAKLIKVGDYKQYYAVQCSKCFGNMAESYEAKVNPAEAVRLWNRRIIAMSPMRIEERAVSDMWDNMIHNIYSAMPPYKKLPCDAEARCRICGTPLKTYYAEGRLYLVKCGYCDTVTIIQADNPFIAAAMVGEVVEE